MTIVLRLKRPLKRALTFRQLDDMNWSERKDVTSEIVARVMVDRIENEDWVSSLISIVN